MKNLERHQRQVAVPVLSALLALSAAACCNNNEDGFETPEPEEVNNDANNDVNTEGGDFNPPNVPDVDEANNDSNNDSNDSNNEAPDSNNETPQQQLPNCEFNVLEFVQDTRAFVNTIANDFVLYPQADNYESGAMPTPFVINESASDTSQIRVGSAGFTNENLTESLPPYLLRAGLLRNSDGAVFQSVQLNEDQDQAVRFLQYAATQTPDALPESYQLYIADGDYDRNGIAVTFDLGIKEDGSVIAHGFADGDLVGSCKAKLSESRARNEFDHAASDLESIYETLQSQ